MKEEVDRLKEKIEEVGNYVCVRPKNRVEGGRTRNGLEQDRLNNIRASEEGLGKEGELIKVKEEGSKRHSVRKAWKKKLIRHFTQDE